MPRWITGFSPFLALAVMALLLTATSARAAADPANLRLTPALLDRVEAVNAEARKLPPPKSQRQSADDDEGSDDESVEDMARKLEADPRVRALLARHRLTSLEYTTAMLAAMHAGMALAAEKAPGAARQAQHFTPAQRANIELLRGRKK